jgi:hypothetical protein
MQYYEQTRNLVARAKEFHHHLDGMNIEDPIKRERVRKHLNYMMYHDRELDLVLAQFNSETSNKLLDIWFKYIPEGNACKCFDIIHVHPQMVLEEVLDISQQIDECLLELYEEISHAWDSQDVKDAFKILLQNARNEKSKIWRESPLLEY